MSDRPLDFGGRDVLTEVGRDEAELAGASDLAAVIGQRGPDEPRSAVLGTAHGAVEVEDQGTVDAPGQLQQLVDLVVRTVREIGRGHGDLAG